MWWVAASALPKDAPTLTSCEMWRRDARAGLAADMNRARASVVTWQTREVFSLHFASSALAARPTHRSRVLVAMSVMDRIRKLNAGLGLSRNVDEPASEAPEGQIEWQGWLGKAGTGVLSATWNKREQPQSEQSPRKKCPRTERFSIPTRLLTCRVRAMRRLLCGARGCAGATALTV